MAKGTEHEWTNRTEEGCKEHVRARLFGKRWTLEAKLDGAEEWTVFAEPRLEDLVDLHDVLFRKYQRGRVAWEHVTDLEKLIRSRGGSLNTDEE